MTAIRVDYDRDVYVTREARDPNDRWDRDDTAADITINGIQIVKGEQRYRDIDVPFEVDINKSYILVWADYNTGDSFGHDDNVVDVIDLFETYEKAENAAKALRSNMEGYKYDCTYTREDGKSIRYHRPWVGYFESLNAVNLSVVRVTGFA